MQINLSPVELTLVAAAVNDKVKWFDQEYHRLAGVRPSDDLDINRVMRSAYAGIVRRVEQVLDVPGVDEQDARAALGVGIAFFDPPEGEPDDEWTNREGMPEFNGSFR